MADLIPLTHFNVSRSNSDTQKHARARTHTREKMEQQNSEMSAMTLLSGCLFIYILHFITKTNKYEY